MSVKLKLSILFLSAFMLIFTISCSEEEKVESKSMEEIHEEEGLPVEIKTIEKTGFSKSLSFYAPVHGIKQTRKSAMVPDEVLKINANIGDYVNEGDIIMEFPTDNPTVQYEQAKTGYETAKKTFDRMKKLLEAGEISQQQYDNTESQYLVSKRNYESIKQMLFVDAPISGTIISMPLRIGDIPARDGELFTVAQLHKMVAKISVSEKEIGSIKKGMKAFAHYNGEEFTGFVTDVPLAMDPATRSFQVEIQFNNPKKELKSGVSVDINVDIMNMDSTIVVPRNIISSDNGKHYVFINDNGSAKITYVELGQESGIEVEITEGLLPGDELINCCKNMVKDGLKIKVVK